MIKLGRIIEQLGTESQFYDLGRDFSNFIRTIDGTSEQVKQKFEQDIGSKLNGKRIRARSSRGYKQYVKDFEFDVSKITLDDYYDNYVVVAHDNTTPKPKEYFLKPGYKIQVLGPASGQPSNEKGKNPGQSEHPTSPVINPDKAQSQPMTPAPAGATPVEQPVKEETNDHYDAYPIETIVEDIKPWLPYLLLKPETPLRDFVKELGWKKNNVVLFNVVLPINLLKYEISVPFMNQVFSQLNKNPNKDGIIVVKEMTLNESKDTWNIKIKKVFTNERK